MISNIDLIVAAGIDDVDEALQLLMKAAGIKYGDCASIVFSGFDWETADVPARYEQLLFWMKSEQAYERA